MLSPLEEVVDLKCFSSQQVKSVISLFSIEGIAEELKRLKVVQTPSPALSQAS